MPRLELAAGAKGGDAITFDQTFAAGGRKTKRVLHFTLAGLSSSSSH